MSEVKCGFCGKQFTAILDTAEYCSPKCRVYASRARARKLCVTPSVTPNTAQQAEPSPTAPDAALYLLRCPEISVVAGVLRVLFAGEGELGREPPKLVKIDGSRVMALGRYIKMLHEQGDDAMRKIAELEGILNDQFDDDENDTSGEPNDHA